MFTVGELKRMLSQFDDGAYVTFRAKADMREGGGQGDFYKITRREGENGHPGRVCIHIKNWFDT